MSPEGRGGGGGGGAFFSRVEGTGPFSSRSARNFVLIV